MKLLHKFQKNFKISFIAIIILGLSCKKDDSIIDSNLLNNQTNIKQYIHISHTRTNSNPSIDSIVEKTDFSKYNMIWLGGDLAHLTSENDQTMKHIDSIFDVGSESTLWSLGNHDYSDLYKIEQYTHRKPFYATYKNGITFLVLDTQDSLSNMVGAQKEMIENVLDTINESHHLILLHHKLIWMYNHDELEPQIATVSNGKFGSCFYCLNPNNFISEIYPELVKVKERNINVICISGDIGFKTNQFEYVTENGIYFLASGIDFKESNNQALVFNHNALTNKLTWEYKYTTAL